MLRITSEPNESLGGCTQPLWLLAQAANLTLRNTWLYACIYCCEGSLLTFLSFITQLPKRYLSKQHEMFFISVSPLRGKGQDNSRCRREGSTSGACSPGQQPELWNARSLSRCPWKFQIKSQVRALIILFHMAKTTNWSPNWFTVFTFFQLQMTFTIN